MGKLASDLKRRALGINLRTKLVVLFLALAVVPISVLGTFSYDKASSVVQSQVCRTILESLSQVNNSLNYFVQDVEQLTMYAYRSDEIQSVLSKPGNRPVAEKYADKQKVNGLLDTFLGFKDWDINIYLIGSNGDRYFTGGLLPGGYDDYNPNWGLFRKMKLAGGNIVWDTRYSMKKTDDYGIVLSSGRMLKNIASDKPLGFVVVDIDESALADKYNKAELQPGSQMLLLDRNGYIISGPSKQHVGTKLAEPYTERLLEKNKGFFQVKQAGGSKAMVIFDTSETSGFKLVSIVPVSELTKASASIRNLTLLVVAAAILVSVLLAYLLSDNITSPLRKLKSLMKQVENGNLDVAFHSRYNDEVGQLGSGFNRMIHRLKELLLEISVKQRMLQQSEMKAIQAQFNPHFLYNALDSINWMARIHKLDPISKIVVALGELLRFSIRKDRSMIPIREDIGQIRNYLLILKMRYGDKFEAAIDIDPDLEPLYSPKLLLQPIVENAITHGLEPKAGKGHLSIDGRITGNRVVFEVADDGIGFAEALSPDTAGLKRLASSGSSHTGIGLENVRKRLEVHFKSEQRLDIRSVPGEGTVVRVEFPIMKSLEEIPDV
ncbi:cache domain-containing sensor histidine kinase [Paenibacillus beijingensis]|uniref:histidine kinase n=1 Tax=Paenibacillus beijingensis TaxID=1126833 RepID=A0A0D5NE44_9BACL|nr:sensor histidine kinase [Paenibacillus beijingensis]AJY73435.1 histidine kinase [Paenibacillus beijingensis]